MPSLEPPKSPTTASPEYFKMVEQGKNLKEHVER